jgi:hypothetical protein
MRVFNIPRNIMTHYNEWRQAGLEARYIADEVVKKRAIKVALAKKVAQAKHAAEQPICLPMFCSQSELISIDRFKETFEFWDEWSGSRFIRRTNPIIAMSTTEFLASSYFTGKDTNKPNINTGTVCRSNPVTGYYDTLNV